MNDRPSRRSGRPPKYGEKTARIHITIPESVHAQLSDLSDETGRSIGELLVSAARTLINAESPRKGTPMNREVNSPAPLNQLIVRAQNVGQYASDQAHALSKSVEGGAHHPGDDTGRLVLEAYRTYGAEDMRAVVRAYQGGYNARAADLGDYVIRWPQIKAGIHWALPGATDQELIEIPAAL